MEDIKGRLITGIISSIIVGTISVATTRLTQDSKYGKQIEDLSTHKTRNEILVSELQQKNFTLSSQLSEKDKTLSNLQKQYSDLEKKYLKCITSEGSTFTIGSFDTELHHDTLRTNDILDFKLTSSSVSFKIVRVSDRGPILLISGCNYFLTENETKSYNDGENCFLLEQRKPLKVKLSPRSCSMGYSQFNEKELEQISIENIFFNHEKQVVNFKYSRTALF